ncbi:MAG: sulfotransferase [Pseudomonadota bacterium]|nr:sulfotransferase [Pseudomonadota bacterium]
MPLATTVLAAADTLAAATGVLRRPLLPEPLLEDARRRTGLGDFGELDIMEPLSRLLEACATESDLSLVGRLATRWDVVRLLSNLLRMAEEERLHPAIVREPIERPIFITGLPRSGTTFLHRLMLEDPFNQAPRVWQTIFPYPLPGRREKRVQLVTRQLRSFELLAPEFRSLHPLDACSPQECSEITAHVFRSLRFDTNYQIPSYRRWLDSDRQLPAYRFHRRFLQHLQHQRTQVSEGSGGEESGRWVLKCPDHLFALQELRKAYPDARVVFVHRDPMKVLLSLTRLTEVLRRPFNRRIDPRRIGREESARWYEGTLRMMHAAEDGLFAEPVCHVHYLDLVTDPVNTVEGVYSHFGLQLDPDAAQRVARAVAEKPDGGYGHHVYKFEDHGLDEGSEREKFRPYMVNFGIETESRRPRRPIGPLSGSLPAARTGAR